MSKVTTTICDRCGKIIENGDDTKLYNVSKKMIFGWKMIRIRKFNANDNCCELCPDCAKQLKEFLKG